MLMKFCLMLVKTAHTSIKDTKLLISESEMEKLSSSVQVMKNTSFPVQPKKSKNMEFQLISHTKKELFLLPTSNTISK
jgi:hypothetical protein